MKISNSNRAVLLLTSLLSLQSFAQIQTNMEKEFAGVEKLAEQVDSDRAKAELLKREQAAEAARLKNIAEIATRASRELSKIEKSVIAELQKDFGGNGQVLEEINTSVREVIFEKEHGESYQLKLIKLDNGFICQLLGTARSYSEDQAAKCVSSQYGAKSYGNQTKFLAYKSIDSAYDQAAQAGYSRGAVDSCINAVKAMYQMTAVADIRKESVGSFGTTWEEGLLREKLALTVDKNTLPTRCYGRK